MIEQIVAYTRDGHLVFMKEVKPNQWMATLNGPCVIEHVIVWDDKHHGPELRTLRIMTLAIGDTLTVEVT